MKIRIPAEIAYVIALIGIAFAVAMTAASDFGVSMIVAPAFILSEKVSFLTFGRAEYVLQALVFIIMCLLLKKLKPVYLVSFLTCILYGAILDLWRLIIPAFNSSVTDPATLPIALRIFFLIGGMVMTAIMVALFFHTYIYPQVYDFFVKAITDHFHLPLNRFKTCYDLGFLTVAVIMSFALFGKLHGVGIGTLIMALLNGTIIGACSKWMDRHLDTTPLLPKFASYFDL